ncbi:hypothetical protein ACOMHN_020491 [Nucella lapillus]
MNSSMDNASSSSSLSPPLFIPCENPRNIVSPFVPKMIDLVVHAGIFPVLVTCGVITNVINMAVFARQGLSNRINVCLFSLALSDAGSLIFVMGSKAHTLISLGDPVAGNYWQQRHLALLFGSYLAFSVISNVITAIIAMERCLCVLNPLKAAKFFRTKHMKMLISAVALYLLVVNNVSLLTKYQTIQVTNPLTNTSSYVNRLTPFHLRHREFLDIIARIVSVTLRILSLFIVIICTTAIFFRLKVTATWRRSTASNMTSVEKQEASMTRMLLTVCCVYVMCMTPSATRTLLLHSIPGFLPIGYLCNIFRVATSLALLLEAFNASINLLIYFNQSSQYRSTLRQLCYSGNQQTKKEGVITKYREHREN